MAKKKKPQGRVDAEDMKVGAIVRERRIWLGMSQMVLADLLGVTFQQLQKYERGANRISAGRIPVLAKALAVSVDFFFNTSPVGVSMTEERDREILELVRAFDRLPDKATRRSVINMIRSLNKK